MMTRAIAIPIPNFTIPLIGGDFNPVGKASERYSFGTVKNSWYEVLDGWEVCNTVCSAILISIPSDFCFPSYISPTANDLVIMPTAPPTVTCAEYGLLNLYFAMST